MWMQQDLGEVMGKTICVICSLEVSKNAKDNSQPLFRAGMPMRGHSEKLCGWINHACEMYDKHNLIN